MTALIMPIGLLFTLGLSFYRDVMRGICQFAESQPDWTFLPLHVDDGGQLRWHGEMAPRGILATLNHLPYVEAVTSWRGPLVNVSATLSDLRYPRVAADNRLVGCMAARHFLERGLERFAFVGYSQHLASEEREASFCEALREAGYSVPCYHSPPGRPFDPSAIQWYVGDGVEDWLLKLPKPVGIFAAGDVLGAALTQVCRELKLCIPDDAAILGVDNDDLYCQLAQPPLSSVNIDARRIGYEAASLLSRLLAGETPPSAPVLVKPDGIQERRSTDVLAMDDENAAAAVRFIRERGHLPITVADVLKAVCTSRRSLERRFQQALGRGIADEIRRVRLARSEKLLAETDLGMEAVARRSGFSSSRHLAATFQRELGESPSQFRRKKRAFTTGRSRRG